MSFRFKTFRISNHFPMPLIRFNATLNNLRLQNLNVVPSMMSLPVFPVLADLFNHDLVALPKTIPLLVRALSPHFKFSTPLSHPPLLNNSNSKSKHSKKKSRIFPLAFPLPQHPKSQKKHPPLTKVKFDLVNPIPMPQLIHTHFKSSRSTE